MRCGVGGAEVENHRPEPGNMEHGVDPGFHTFTTSQNPRSPESCTLLKFSHCVKTNMTLLGRNYNIKYNIIEMIEESS